MGIFNKGKKFRKNHKPTYSTAKDLKKRKVSYFLAFKSKNAILEE
jgi:hypothetical protein